MCAKKKYKVVACIVTYNNPLEQILNTSDSFLRASICKRLLIVDNNSPNGLLQQLEDRIEANLIDSGTNRGFGFGHNVGIRSSPDCEYFLVMNPDVIIHQDTLEKMTDYLDDHSEVGLLCPKILNEDGSVQCLNKRLPTVFDLFARRFLPKWIQIIPSIKRRMEYYIMKDCGYESIQEVPFVSGCFMLFRKKILDQIGFFDENFFMYLEDTDITVRVNQISKAVYYPDATITHTWSRGSHKSLRFTFITIKSAIYFFNKWGWRWI
jgi:GT2 family glycosyltransferase